MKMKPLKTKKIEKSWKSFQEWRTRQHRKIIESKEWQEYDKKIDSLLKDLKVKTIKQKFLFWEWEEKESDYFFRAMSISNQISFLTQMKLALLDSIPKETYENYLTWKDEIKKLQKQDGKER